LGSSALGERHTVNHKKVIVYEWVDRRDQGAISEWREGLQTNQQAQLDGRIDALRGADIKLAQSLMTGTIQGTHIRKLRLGGKVRLRPLLCLGPSDPRAAITFLAGATERDSKLAPPGVLGTACVRREEILHDPTRRRRYE
jgi:hypothetical protein